MKQLVLVVILVLILITSFVKNSTKEMEDQIFAINENIRPLKSEFEDVLLEFNYLSSPEKLVQYQTQYFEKDLIKIEIMKIKEITENNKNLKINNFHFYQVCLLCSFYLQLRISYYLLLLTSLNEAIVLNKLLKSLRKQKK